MELGLRVALLVVLVAFGVLLGGVGVLGWRDRLSRTGRLGVRTPAAIRDDETFRLANRVAGPPVLVAGLAAILGGLGAISLPGVVGMMVAVVVGALGAVLIARAGGVLGHRAAVALAQRRPAACAGCACGGCALTRR